MARMGFESTEVVGTMYSLHRIFLRFPNDTQTSGFAENGKDKVIPIVVNTMPIREQLRGSGANRTLSQAH